MSAMLAVLALVIALPGAAAATHIALLALASLLYREPNGADPVPRVRFCVLIPARNEETVIGKTLDAIERERRLGDPVLVVAHRCTDSTAAIARSRGALVLELSDDMAPPTRAAARQAGVDYALSLEWDAMVMIDADSLIEPGFFANCERMLALGAQALQARSESALDKRLVAQAYVAAFALQGVTYPRARDRLGLSVRLRGTGMVLRRALLERYRFRPPASEDLWFSLDLCLDGILPRHVESARLRSDSVGSWKAASGQRLRYEAGRLSAAREYLVPLLRRHSAASIEAAWLLVTPPFAVAVASLALGAILAVAAQTVPVILVLLVFLGLLALSLTVALVQAKAGIRTWLALLSAPWYVPWKVLVQARALASVRRHDVQHGPTPRG